MRFCVVTLKCLFIRIGRVTTNCFTVFCKQLDSDIRRSSVLAEAFEMRWHQGIYCVYSIYHHWYVGKVTHKNEDILTDTQAVLMFELLPGQMSCQDCVVLFLDVQVWAFRVP